MFQEILFVSVVSGLKYAQNFYHSYARTQSTIRSGRYLLQKQGKESASCKAVKHNYKN